MHHGRGHAPVAERVSAAWGESCRNKMEARIYAHVCRLEKLLQGHGWGPCAWAQICNADKGWQTK